MRYKVGKFSVVALGAAVLLAACGGGGGGSSGPSYGGPTAPVAISVDNADALADKGIGFATTDSSIFDTGVGSIIGIPGIAAKTAFPKGLDGYLQDAYIAEKTRLASMGLRASEEWTEDCDTGSIRISVKYSDPETVRSGDVVNVSFKNCELGSYSNSVVISGSASLAFTSVVGDILYSDTYQVSLTSTAKNLKFAMKQDGTLTGDYALMHGSYTQSVNSAYPDVSVRLTSSSILMQAVESGTLMETLLEGVDQSYTFDTFTGQASYSNDFTLYSTGVGGKLVVDTTAPFEIEGWGDNPSSGTMIITGANGAKLKITVVDAITGYDVALDLDADGTYEHDPWKRVAW